MNFIVFFVDDKKLALENAKEAIDHYNGQINSRRIELWVASSVEEFEKRLSPQVDLIVTDVHYRNEQGDEPRRLEEIIRAVKGLRLKEHQPDGYPIIAYTDKGSDTLEHCLGLKKELYDIWDKSTSSYEYMVWRISKIALEISRRKPNRLLQKLIRTMVSPLPWHKYVVQMVDFYERGWNEADQITQIGSAIVQIGDQFGTGESCKRFWNIMELWEKLSRATSNKARGHARHVANVFWLGYYILHSDHLQKAFRKSWDTVKNRIDVKLPGDHLVNLANIWFYAALFHDSGQFIEKSDSIGEAVRAITKEFGKSARDSTPDTKTNALELTEAFQAELAKLCGEMHPKLTPAFESLWRNSLKGKVDHGIVAALNSRMDIETSKRPDQIGYIKEASRAMAIHNLIGELPQEQSVLEWAKEPIACLLVLCDQLQSWDRERGDNTILGEDKPDRAEFTEFHIEKNGAKVLIGGTINYLAPSRLDHSPEHFAKTKFHMEDVLKQFPKKALSRIGGDWPFELKFDCWLNDIPLDTKITGG